MEDSTRGVSVLAEIKIIKIRQIGVWRLHLVVDLAVSLEMLRVSR